MQGRIRKKQQCICRSKKSGDKLGEYILASNYEDLYYTVKSAQKKDKEMVEYDSVVITGGR